VVAREGDGHLTEVHVAAGTRYLGSILLADAIREDALVALDHLRALGLPTILLTGDREATGRQVAAELGIDEVHAGQTPEDKARFVGGARERGRQVLMVGDGINDAPALSAANVGCAVAGGTDVALETSDLVLTRPDLERIPLALNLARGTLRVIHQNLFWAFAYNILAIPLAAAGRLAPVYAAGAMALSSVCVLANSLRLSRWAGVEKSS
jgi:Cu2+-exporting ATPase